MLYDIPVRFPVTSYVGVGAGGQILEVDNLEGSTPGPDFPHRGGSPSISSFSDQAIAGFHHSVLIGLRYAFNSAPPPRTIVAAAAMAPAPAPTHLVFFNWNRSDLSSQAREIIAQAVQSSTRVQTTRIEVNGYTDSPAAHPGPRGEPFNTGLSMRRAQSVEAGLIRDGMPGLVIDIHGYGEANPLVPARMPASRRTSASRSSCAEPSKLAPKPRLLGAG